LRAVVQRVSEARVEVDRRVVGEIQHGLLVYLGVQKGDAISDVEYLASKVAGLRIFEDQQHKMNLSLQDVSGRVLVISQFTLLGDVRRGKRPSFIDAAEPQVADQLYQQFGRLLESQGIGVARGIFQADMQVSSTNDGPVTILLDSRKLF
jgi:D-aminoacyl-tRNA deacylase